MKSTVISAQAEIQRVSLYIVMIVIKKHFWFPAKAHTR
jgi:hypothetical protein